MNAAIYFRVSTDEQVRDGVSLELQERECSARAAAEGATSITGYRDEGISGTKWARPGLQALLAALPETDLLVVWAKDRLTRNLRHLLTILDAVAENGVRLVALRESVDLDTAEGRLSTGILGAISQYHPDKTSENVKAALRRIAETGRLPSGCPYGYRRNAAKEIEPNPDEAPIVREIFQRFASGDSIHSIGLWLNAEGIPCKRGGAYWRPRTISEVLSHKVHSGLIEWGDIVLPGNHEAIVDDETFATVQRILDLRKFQRGRPTATFTPLFRCGICGGHMSRIVTRRACSFSCRRRLMDHDVHPYLQVTENKAIAAVWRHTELLLSDGTLQDAIQRAKDRQKRGRKDEPAIQHKLDDLARRRRVNLLALQNGSISPDDLLSMNAPLMEAEEELRALLEATDVSADVAALESLRKIGPKNLLARLRAIGVEQQVVALKGLYAGIEVHPGNVLRFVSAFGGIEPVDRQLPAYFWRGSDLDW